MEKKHRENNDLKKRLEMKINEHKMLTNTLYEALEKKGSSVDTLNNIKSAIDSTLNEINILKEEMNNGGVTYATYNAYKKVSFFDKIGKKEPIKVLSGCEPKYNYKHPYDDKEYEIKHTSITDAINTDSILFCNRFLFDLSVIGIPETMVKSVYVSTNPENVIEVQIYDFITAHGTPIMGELAAYNGRKFTCEIEHLDATGMVVYKEKYNGCYLDTNINRDSLCYERSEPATIMIKIRFDGVSYEAGH